MVSKSWRTPSSVLGGKNSNENTGWRRPSRTLSRRIASTCYGHPMLAVYAAAIGGDDPLANIAVGDLPAPAPQPGWALVKVRAASLNHHDIWTLRGVAPAPA